LKDAILRDEDGFDAAADDDDDDASVPEDEISVAKPVGSRRARFLRLRHGDWWILPTSGEGTERRAKPSPGLGSSTPTRTVSMVMTAASGRLPVLAAM
jgi:hypothetical protein